MSEFLSLVASLAITVLIIYGGIYLGGPYWDKRECEESLPRHVECTYQPPATTAPEGGDV